MVLQEAETVVNAIQTKVRPPVMGDDEEFSWDPALNALADELIERHHLPAGQYRVRYLWKRKGGKVRGAPRFGHCQLTTGLIGWFGDCEAVIWLAADTLAGKPDRYIEACLFHELLHIGSDDKTLDIKLTNHDFDGFTLQLDAYGLHLEQLEAAAEHFQKAMGL
jgi:hypothetical protein